MDGASFSRERRTSATSAAIKPLTGDETRWRVIYRSGALARLTPSGENWLIAKGLKTIIDVRAPDELVEAPDVFAGSDCVRHRHVPLFDAPLPMGAPPLSLLAGYERILFQCGERIRAVFHCCVIR
ncbi:MAG: tyrosine-protein phosphatase [Chloroflexi bacterium]|nr:tyrosine-protein phosphatase [Chloroflexota bacterium]MBV9597030.1 tyrosine-protein phosphatase [Chloroflexota bacterium]